MKPTQLDVANARPAMRPTRPPQVISSSNPKKRKSPSSAWDNFEKFIDEKGKTKARYIYIYIYIVARSTWLIAKFTGHLI